MSNGNERSVKLDARLSSAAEFVHGCSIADIGTDHAFLPISLLLSGKCTSAIASDVNIGPLEAAKRNAEKYGLTDKMVFCLADGLAGLPLDEYSVSDIFVCGMGGELIASIIASSDYPKKSGVRLIMQPMTHSADLRRYLAGNGFLILDESLSEDCGRIYECIAAEYDGTTHAMTDAEAELGRTNIERGNKNPLFVRRLISSYITVMRQIDGMKKGGLPTENLDRLANEYRNIAERCGIEL